MYMYICVYIYIYIYIYIYMYIYIFIQYEQKKEKIWMSEVNIFFRGSKGSSLVPTYANNQPIIK